MSKEQPSPVVEVKTDSTWGRKQMVQALDDAEDIVRNGSMTGICIVMVSPDGSNTWIKGGCYSPTHMIGALEVAKHRVIQEEYDE